MKLNNKRGVSGVITAVLLILLVIAAIGVIWVVVINFINEGSGAIVGSADCLTTVLSIESVTVGTATTIPPGSVTVKRTDGTAVLDRIKVLVQGIEVTTTTSTFGAGLDIGETAPLSSITVATGNTVEVAAVIDEKPCSVSDSAIA